MATFYLCFAKSLNAQLEELSKAGKQGRLAATQVTRILDTIRRDGFSKDSLTTKRTKKGEARIDKCIKYDLGHGYRLVTVRWQDHLYITFVGSHDKADLWLEHNRLDDINTKKSCFRVEKITTRAQAEKRAATVCTVPCQDMYEEMLLSKVNEKILRQVFSGLISNQN